MEQRHSVQTGRETYGTETQFRLGQRYVVQTRREKQFRLEERHTVQTGTETRIADCKGDMKFRLKERHIVQSGTETHTADWKKTVQLNRDLELRMKEAGRGRA
jgi:hypothetical protein